MKISEFKQKIQTLSPKEILTELNEEYKKLEDLMYKKLTADFKNNQAIKNQKRLIARLQTILRVKLSENIKE